MKRREIYFEVNDIILRGDFFPSGAGRTVILVHGGGQTRESWGEVAEGLQGSGWDVVAIDLRGHGASGWSRDGHYSIHKFSDDLVEVARHFNKPHIIGAYLGGLVGFNALLDGHGSLFGNLLMIDAVPLFAPTSVRMIMGRMGHRRGGSFTCPAHAQDGSGTFRRGGTKFPRERKNFQLGEDGRPKWRWDPVLIGALDKGRTRYTKREFSGKLANIVNPLSIINGFHYEIPKDIICEVLGCDVVSLSVINVAEAISSDECMDCVILRELTKILERA